MSNDLSLTETWPEEQFLFAGFLVRDNATYIYIVAKGKILSRSNILGLLHVKINVCPCDLLIVIANAEWNMRE